jgi:hypothetical protein
MQQRWGGRGRLVVFKSLRDLIAGSSAVEKEVRMVTAGFKVFPLDILMMMVDQGPGTGDRRLLQPVVWCVWGSYGYLGGGSRRCRWLGGGVSKTYVTGTY